VVTLGVVLLIAAALLGVDLVLENSGMTDVMIMGQLLSFDVWGLFVLGVATGVLMVAGVQLLATGLARDRQKAKARRQAAREAAAAPGTGTTPPTVPQLAVPRGPSEVPTTGPPVSRPKPGPFDRVVARRRDKPDQPTAAV
jgi:hypothetical protein